MVGRDPFNALEERFRLLSDVSNLNDCMILRLKMLASRSKLSSLFNLNKLSEPVYDKIVRNKNNYILYSKLNKFILDSNREHRPPPP